LSQQYTAVLHSLRRRWEVVIPFFHLPAEAIRNKGQFLSDEATHLLGAEEHHCEVARPLKEWHAAKLLFGMQFGDRFVKAASRGWRTHTQNRCSTVKEEK